MLLQHNKSTEIAGHRVLFPKEEDPETILPLRYSAHKVRQQRGAAGMVGRAGRGTQAG